MTAGPIIDFLDLDLTIRYMKGISSVQLPQTITMYPYSVANTTPSWKERSSFWDEFWTLTYIRLGLMIIFYLYLESHFKTRTGSQPKWSVLKNLSGCIEQYFNLLNFSKKDAAEQAEVSIREWIGSSIIPEPNHTLNFANMSLVCNTKKFNFYLIPLYQQVIQVCNQKAIFNIQWLSNLGNLFKNILVFKWGDEVNVNKIKGEIVSLKHRDQEQDNA